MIILSYKKSIVNLHIENNGKPAPFREPAYCLYRVFFANKKAGKPLRVLAFYRLISCQQFWKNAVFSSKKPRFYGNGFLAQTLEGTKKAPFLTLVS